MQWRFRCKQNQLSSMKINKASVGVRHSGYEVLEMLGRLAASQAVQASVDYHEARPRCRPFFTNVWDMQPVPTVWIQKLRLPKSAMPLGKARLWFMVIILSSTLRAIQFQQHALIVNRQRWVLNSETRDCRLRIAMP